MNVSLSPFTLENLVSRDGFDSPVTCQPTHLLHVQAKYSAYNGFISISAELVELLLVIPY